MDPFKGQGGIQMLLIAEQEAQHIVSNARNCKTPFFYSIVIKVYKKWFGVEILAVTSFF